MASDRVLANEMASGTIAVGATLDRLSRAK